MVAEFYYTVFSVGFFRNIAISCPWFHASMELIWIIMIGISVIPYPTSSIKNLDVHSSVAQYEYMMVAFVNKQSSYEHHGQ
jgi:hypothetical protein